MDKLKAIEGFLAVSKTGSFAAAGKALGVSTAMISKRVRQLEDQLGHHLLHRTTRTVSLTEVGSHYAQLWDDVFQRVREEEMALASLHSEPRGRLRITAPRSLGELQIAAAIAEFVRTYPDLRVELDLAVTSPTAVQLVERGFDVGIRVIPPPLASRAVGLKLARYDWKVCATPEFLRLNETPRTPADLMGMRCITTPIINAQVRYSGDWEFVRSGKRTLVKVKSAVVVNSLAALRKMALRSAGLARLPSYCVDDDLRQGRLVHVLREYELEPGFIYAIYYRGKASNKVQLFINFLKRELDRRI